jgi:hypothetical protein
MNARKRLILVVVATAVFICCTQTPGLGAAAADPAESPQQFELVIEGADLSGKGILRQMAPANINATNVQIEELLLHAVPTTATFAPASIGIYEFPVK